MFTALHFLSTACLKLFACLRTRNAPPPCLQLAPFQYRQHALLGLAPPSLQPSAARALFTFVLQVSYKNADEQQSRFISALPQEEQWVCNKISLPQAGVVDFWSRNIGAVIKKLYGSHKHGAGFAFESDVAAKSAPFGTSVWLREEAHVKGRVGNHAVIAGVQLFADATVVNLKGTSFHPVYMCLLNHTYSEKIKAIETVAYLPHVEHDPECPPEQRRLNKLLGFHKAFDVLLSPLHTMRSGEWMKGPDQLDHFVVPVLLNFIGDNLEVSEAPLALPGLALPS